LSRSPVGRADQPAAGDAGSSARCEAVVDNESLVGQLLTEGRYAWLQRPQVAGDLAAHQKRRAFELLQAAMSLVPAGDVLVQPWLLEALEDHSHWAFAARRLTMDAVYLDRYPVTNREFHRFVTAGGYGQKSLWHPTIWERVTEFVDRSRVPGPRGWKEGTFSNETAQHPVTGVNWFEADAYARWIGKRLPTDAEWVKAAAWPVVIDGDELIQRRFPWGDILDYRRANLWSSGPGHVVPVTDYPEGASVGGVHQLIGNVWEWTSGGLAAAASNARVRLNRPLKSIRGGAFDTYFDSQVGCQLQSGDCPFARRGNIGFRCALSACDVASHLSGEDRRG